MEALEGYLDTAPLFDGSRASPPISDDELVLRAGRP